MGEAAGPAAINDAGQVVGSAGSNPFIITPIINENGKQIWYADANQDGINDLVFKLPPLVTGQPATACALNSAGGVAGWARTSAGVPHAMLWRVDAQGNVTTTDLGLLKGEAEAYAWAVNDSFQVVGDGRTYHMKQRIITNSSFLWQNGVMSALRSLVDQPALLTGLNNVASDINNQGMIVGYGTTDTGSRFVYYPFIAVPIR